MADDTNNPYPSWEDLHPGPGAAPEPSPIRHTGEPSVWELVQDDIRGQTYACLTYAAASRLLADAQARDEFGRDKYGTPLQPSNGRDHLVDAYQEALDLMVYLRAQLEVEPSFGLATMYSNATLMAGNLAGILQARGK